MSMFLVSTASRIFYANRANIAAVTTHHHTLKDPNAIQHVNTAPLTITLVTNSLTVGLLAACRLINDEARKIFNAKLETLRQEPTRYIVFDECMRSFDRIVGLVDLAMLNICAYTDPDNMPGISRSHNKWGDDWPEVNAFVIKSATHFLAASTQVPAMIRATSLLITIKQTSLFPALPLEGSELLPSITKVGIIVQDTEGYPSHMYALTFHEAYQQRAENAGGRYYRVSDKDPETWALEWEEGDSNEV
jgi:hypothetical protein